MADAIAAFYTLIYFEQLFNHYKATYTQPIFYIGYALKAKIFSAGEEFADILRRNSEF